MRERLGSVRVRVTGAATIVAFLAVAAMAVAVVQVHRAALLDGVDERMEDAAEAMLEDALAGRAPEEVPGFDDDESTFELRSPSGRTLAAGGELDDGATRQRTEEEEGLVVRITASIDDVDESVGTLAATFVVVVPAMTLVLALGVWLLVGRALRPVEAIRREVAAIGGADLHRRVPEPPGGDEVARLARTMNEMLGRVEAARDRQQRFVADASHELRSPLTRMRTELEVDQAHPEQADPVATGASVLDEVVGMQRVVEDLLHLARIDSGVAPGPPEAVALDAIVLRAADDLRASGTAVDTSDVAPLELVGDREPLRRLVANLLDNAGRHARSTVRVSLASLGGSAVLTVADDGPGIAPADRERVFERFTRLDAARSAATGGTGLGLAIVREVAAQHGGTVVVDDALEGGARFTVTLPVA